MIGASQASHLYLYHARMFCFPHSEYEYRQRMAGIADGKVGASPVQDASALQTARLPTHSSKITSRHRNIRLDVPASPQETPSFHSQTRREVHNRA